MATISDWQLHGIVTSTDNVQHVSARRRTECEMKIRPYASRLWLSPSESWKKIIIGQRHLCDFVLLRHIHKKTFDQIYNKSNAKNEYIYIYFFILRNSPQWARASSFRSILDHTQRHTTFGRTPLDKWSARRRHLYLTTHNTHNRKKIYIYIHTYIYIYTHTHTRAYIHDLSFRDIMIYRSTWLIFSR